MENPMILILRASMAMILFVLIAAVVANPVEDEVKKLEGTWVVVSATLDGKPIESEERAREVSFAGYKLVIKTEAGKEEKWTFKIDPTKKPKTLDVTPEVKATPAKVGSAIYELDGDRLKICIDDPRPKEFTDTDQPLLIFKRKR